MFFKPYLKEPSTAALHYTDEETEVNQPPGWSAVKLGVLESRTPDLYIPLFSLSLSLVQLAYSYILGL
jgi:hypothetical protein